MSQEYRITKNKLCYEKPRSNKSLLNQKWLKHNKIRKPIWIKFKKNETFSTGRVKQAVAMAARRRRRKVNLRREDQWKAIDNLLRQGLHSSSSWSSGVACFNDKRGLNPPKLARFSQLKIKSNTPKMIKPQENLYNASSPKNNKDQLQYFLILGWIYKLNEALFAAFLLLCFASTKMLFA